MNVKQVKETIRTWIADNAGQYPGLCAAHLVGSITDMAEEFPFPEEKDVDLHLIFVPGSPSLVSSGPFSNNLEFLLEGLMVEGGLKPASEYRDAETVLSNPEIAYHLTMDSILYDPQQLLSTMQPQIKRGYNHRRWVGARIEHERRGWKSVADIYSQIPETAISTRVSLMGYSYSFLSSLLCVANLEAPTVSLVKMREILAAYHRLDLYEAHLEMFGLHRVTPQLTAQFLGEASEAFDLAVQVRKTPHPFQHKLYPHLRPYFIGKCQRLLEEGHWLDAMSWIIPFYIASCDVLIVDGNATESAKYRNQLHRFLGTLGLGTSKNQQARWSESRQLGEAFFDLANEIVNAHPDMVD